jgi:hypothetical protein
MAKKGPDKNEQELLPLMTLGKKSGKQDNEYLWDTAEVHREGTRKKLYALKKLVEHDKFMAGAGGEIVDKAYEADDGNIQEDAYAATKEAVRNEAMVDLGIDPSIHQDAFFAAKTVTPLENGLAIGKVTPNLLASQDYIQDAEFDSEAAREEVNSRNYAISEELGNLLERKVHGYKAGTNVLKEIYGAKLPANILAESRVLALDPKTLSFSLRTETGRHIARYNPRSQASDAIAKHIEREKREEKPQHVKDAYATKSMDELDAMFGSDDDMDSVAQSDFDDEFEA